MLITKNLFVHDIFLLCINSFLNVNLLLSQFSMMMLQITQFFLFFFICLHCDLCAHNYLDWFVKVYGWWAEHQQSAGKVEEKNANFIKQAM